MVAPRYKPAIGGVEKHIEKIVERIEKKLDKAFKILDNDKKGI